MLTSEELKKFTKLTTQDAWRQEMNTTLNDMVEYICFRVGEKLLEDYTTEVNLVSAKLEELLENTITNQVELESIKDYMKDTQNASKDGGIQKPQRSKKAGA